MPMNSVACLPFAHEHASVLSHAHWLTAPSEATQHMLAVKCTAQTVVPLCRAIERLDSVTHATITTQIITLHNLNIANIENEIKTIETIEKIAKISEMGKVL